MIFTIDTENNITAHADTPVAQDGLIPFATEKELTKATAEWPIPRLVETWNGFAGTPGSNALKPVKKFTDRKTATGRIWNAIQALAVPVAAGVPAPAEVAALAAPKKKAKAAKPATAPREGTAKAKVLAMIQKKGGATLEEIAKATGWQNHTIRGFMSVIPKKAGLTVTSSRREDGARVYEAK